MGFLGVDISRDWERKCKREDGGRGVGGDMAVSWGCFELRVVLSRETKRGKGERVLQVGGEEMDQDLQGPDGQLKYSFAYVCTNDSQLTIGLKYYINSKYWE